MNHDEFDPYAQWLGIGPDEHPIDHYRLLGLARFEADPQRISAAADARMRHVRSFQTGPRGLYTQKLLNELAAAKLRLLDPQSKQAYDERLRKNVAQTRQTTNSLLSDEDIVLPPPAMAAEPPVDSLAPAHLRAAPINASPPAAADALAGTSISPQVPVPIPQPAAEPAQSAPIVQPVITPANRHVAGRTARGGGGSRTQARAGKRPMYVYAFLFLLGVAVIAAAVWQIGRTWSPPPAGDSIASDSSDTAGTKQGPGAASTGSGVVAGSKVAVQQASGHVRLTAMNAEIHGTTPQRVIEGAESVIADWTSSDDWLSWQIQIRKGGLFRLKLTYAVHPDAATGRIRFELDGQSRERDLRDSGGPETFVTDELLVQMTKPGIHHLVLRAVDQPGADVMIFKQIELEPFRR